MVTLKLSVIGPALSISSVNPLSTSALIVSPSSMGFSILPIDKIIALLPKTSLLLSVANDVSPMTKSLFISRVTNI